MEPSRIPMTSVQTGFTREERSIEWRVSNFGAIKNNRSMLDFQGFEFYAGESIGMTSKWRAYLNVEERDGASWVGIFVRLVEKPRSTSTPEHLYAQLICTFKGRDGAKKELVTKVVDWHDPTVVKVITNGYGFLKVFKMSDEIPSFVELVDGCLIVHITLNLFAPAKVNQPLEVKLEEFQVKSRARSPVFQAMLDEDMAEGNAGVVQIPDMGSESLKTMLHFMNCGELLPEWKSSEVVVELTNAAAKYELTDLFNFLDGVLGDVCTLDNVGMLIALTHRLSLKTAEADLLSFVKREGASSSENFLQVSNGILASESRTEEGSGAPIGADEDRIEGRPTCASCRCGRPGKRNADDMDENVGGETTPKLPRNGIFWF